MLSVGLFRTVRQLRIVISQKCKQRSRSVVGPHPTPRSEVGRGHCFKGWPRHYMLLAVTLLTLLMWMADVSTWQPATVITTQNLALFLTNHVSWLPDMLLYKFCDAVFPSFPHHSFRNAGYQLEDSTAVRIYCRRLELNDVFIAVSDTFIHNNTKRNYSFRPILRGCVQKFPDWVDNEIYAYNNNSVDWLIK